MHHYTDSGLDNIYLTNGYEVHKTAYGEGVSIEDLDGLHRAIGQWLVKQPKPLKGAELRFLRNELDLSQKKLGLLIGKTELTVGRWERAATKPFDPVADRLIRGIYVQTVEGDHKFMSIIKLLAEADQIEHATKCQLEERNGRWSVSEPAMAA